MLRSSVSTIEGDGFYLLLGRRSHSYGNLPAILGIKSKPAREVEPGSTYPTMLVQGKSNSSSEKFREGSNG